MSFVIAAICIALFFIIWGHLAPWVDALRAAGWDYSRFTPGSIALFVAACAAVTALIAVVWWAAALV